MSNGYIPKTAMFIVAHPDDLEFGVAGTAAKWARGGSRNIYVVITDGNVGSHENGMTREKLAEVRRAEQTAAADVVGAECIFLGYDDGFLQPTLELRKKLVRLMRQYRPDTIVCMDPTNFFPSDDYINHPDHRAAGQATLDAVFPAVEMDLLYPDLAAEGLTGYKVNYVYVILSQKANCYIDISDTIDLKVEALKKHASQFEVNEAAKMIRTWAAEAGQKVGFDYAEAFYRITLKSPEEPQSEQ
ncbi:MAG: PIG-L family deacetylase [Candidatus Promineofilum sp.]|nr:PIG-L family deacetylase [Promineifilum sp.]MBP9656434.1 PIG-L family deacetylase [Promineifilum sp.]